MRLVVFVSIIAFFAFAVYGCANSNNSVNNLTVLSERVDTDVEVQHESIYRLNASDVDRYNVLHASALNAALYGDDCRYQIAIEAMRRFADEAGLVGCE